MSTYRLLADHYVNNQLFQAGTTQSTADVGGLFPVGWSPTPFVDPLDTAAVNAFYAQGPFAASIYSSGLVRSVLVGLSVNAPITYWKKVSRPWSKEFGPQFGPLFELWSLTGLGSALAPIGI